MKKLLLLLLFLATALQTFAINISDSIFSGGVYRKFIIHTAGVSVPTSQPVMFVLHGDGGSGPNAKSYMGFDSIADQNNFMAVYPTAHQAGGLWNKFVDNVAGDGGTGNANAVDDVQFFNDLILYLCNTYQINKTKVYATGHSGGAFMCYHLALRLADKIAAIAPVAGSLWGDNSYLNTAFTSPTYIKVPIYHIHGDADATVSYPDPNHTPNAWSEWPFSSFAYYGCTNSTYTSTTNIAGTTTVGSVKKLSFCPGPASSTAKEISLIRMVGGGHGWPNAGGYKPAKAIWDFCNQYNIVANYSCSTAPPAPVNGNVLGGIPSANTSLDIKTNGRFILGPQGDTIILRGVNYAPYNWGYTSSELRVSEIATTGANAVRLVWYTSASSGPVYTNFSLIDSAITACKNKGLIAILELHDQTCNNDSTAMMNLATWWTSPSMRNILNKHRGYVMLNVANEALGSGLWGWLGGTNSSFKNIYKAVITKIRSGVPAITCPIMIDAPECGSNELIFTTGTIADSLIAHDPLHNIIFSVHAYWPLPSNNANTLLSRLNNIKNKNVPIVLGEVAYTSDCSDVILLDSILIYAKQRDIGYLVWSWDRDNCAARQISTNGLASSLTNAGLTLIQNPVYGIFNSAVLMLAPVVAPFNLASIYLNFKTKNKATELFWQASNPITDVKILASNGAQNSFTEIANVQNETTNFLTSTNLSYYKIAGKSNGQTVESNTIYVPQSNKIIVTNSNIQIALEKATTIKIFNMQGACIMQQQLASGSNTIDINSLSIGVYLLQIGDGSTVKFVRVNE